MAPSLRDAIRSIHFFKNCSTEVLEGLQEASRLLQVPAGRTVIRQGEEVTGLYGIISGRIEISSALANGRRFIRRFGEPGQIWGFVGVFDGKGSPYFYTVQEPSRILFVPKSRLLLLLKNNPEFWATVARQLSVIHRSTLADIEELLFSNLNERVLRILRSLGEAYGTQEGDCISIKITQEDLAAMVGVTRQSISKELARFEHQKLIRISYRRVILTDVGAIDRQLLS
jgi:CRP-like cAMP-binding protein